MKLSRSNIAIELAITEGFLLPDLSTGNIYNTKGKVVGYVNQSGYLQTEFHGLQLLNHRLVAYAVWGNDLFQSGIQVNHINANKLDNRAFNLELVTPAENIQHAWRLGLSHNPSGEEAHNVKLTSEQVVSIREMVSKGLTYRRIGAIFNVSRSTVYKIVKGQTWQR